jgi:hypothetical protein
MRPREWAQQHTKGLGHEGERGELRGYEKDTALEEDVGEKGHNMFES